MKSTRRGFTLIELLVVIAIIGLMSSVVLAALTTARMQGRDARRVSDLRQIRYALDLYQLDKEGKYPYLATLRNCVGSTQTGASGYIPNLAPTYISILPLSPFGNSTDCYADIGQADGNPAGNTTGNVNYKISAKCESYTAANNPMPDPQPTRATNTTQCYLAIYTKNSSPNYPTAVSCAPGVATGLGATCW